MLFTPDALDARELEVVALIEAAKKSLRHRLAEPRRWSGSLRRLSVARAIQGSNSIEGFDASLDDAAAIALGEEPLDADLETRLALEGYRDAMTYVLQLADDAHFVYSEQTLKALHFMMTKHELKNRPGLWRAGDMYVRDERTGDVVHEGPPIEMVPGLIAELVESLNTSADLSDDFPDVVLAAMAHLNLAMIHPFRDGNGRMARCLQSLVLARSGTLAATFMSIEEYLGRNTPGYYAVLAEVGGGSWKPDRDVRPWVRFTLTAHLRQADTVIRRIDEGEHLWRELERVVAGYGLPQRALYCMFDAAMGFRVRNATYRAVLADSDTEITEATASTDLRRMVNAGFLVAVGEKRGRFYRASPLLANLRTVILSQRGPRDDSDPFA